MSPCEARRPSLLAWANLLPSTFVVSQPYYAHNRTWLGSSVPYPTYTTCRRYSADSCMQITVVLCVLAGALFVLKTTLEFVFRINDTRDRSFLGSGAVAPEGALRKV